MTPGIHLCRDPDGPFLAELTPEGHWLAFGYTLSVPIQPDEILAGPFTAQEILAAVLKDRN